MHKIAKVKIKNYRSIENLELELTEYTPLVGYNNAGKSNVMHAIEWVLSKSKLTATDYLDSSKSVEVEGEITDISDDLLQSLDDRHRNSISPYLFEGVLTIKREQEPAKDKPNSIRILDENGDWKLNPMGIDVAIKALFPEPIYIGAMENASEDVAKNAGSTTISKLLKELTPQLEQDYESKIKTALEPIADELSAQGMKKDARLVSLDKQMEAQLGNLFSGVGVRSHVGMPAFADFAKRTTLKLYDTANNALEPRDVSTFGHGTQRMVQFALINCLAEARANSGENASTTLLLIDEPELYLHPQAIEVMRRALKKLSNSGYQVVFSTHSAGMITKDAAADAYLIRKNDKNLTEVRVSTRQAVEDTMDQSPAQSDMLFELSSASEILFSDKIIIAEGKTERAVLPTLYSVHHGNTLSIDRFGLVTMSGSGSCIKACPIFDALDIPFKLIIDLDAVFKALSGSKYLDSNDNRIINAQSIFNAMENNNELTLGNDGWPCGGSICTAAEAFEKFASNPNAQKLIDSLHGDLLRKNIWFWKSGAIEVPLGLTSKKPKDHIKFVMKLEQNGSLPNLPGKQEIIEMLNWLKT